MIRVLLVVIMLAAAGCSISTSSDSSAESGKSSATSSNSISRSSGDKKAAYRDDVRTYTAANLKRSGSLDAFEKQLGDLARQYGLTNWEEDDATYVSIGKGLREASAGPKQVATYAAHFSRSDPHKMAMIQRGYDTQP